MESKTNRFLRGFLPEARVGPSMDSVRKGLRSGDIEKDTYERLNCSGCEVTLETKNDPDALGKVRRCPECGKEWQRIG